MGGLRLAAAAAAAPAPARPFPTAACFLARYSASYTCEREKAGIRNQGVQLFLEAIKHERSQSNFSFSHTFYFPTTQPFILSLQ